MRLFTVLVLTVVTCAFSADAVARKKTAHRASVPDPIAVKRPNGQLNSFSFVSKFGKKGGEIYTSVTLACNSGFAPVWHTNESGERGLTLDYFGCIPSDAVFDWSYTSCRANDESCAGTTVFTTANNQPLSLATYEVASFRRREKFIPLCRFIEEVKPELGRLVDIPGPQRSPDGSINCFPQCAEGRCQRTILFLGALDRVGG